MRDLHAPLHTTYSGFGGPLPLSCYMQSAWPRTYVIAAAAAALLNWDMQRERRYVHVLLLLLYLTTARLGSSIRPVSSINLGRDDASWQRGNLRFSPCSAFLPPFSFTPTNLRVFEVAGDDLEAGRGEEARLDRRRPDIQAQDEGGGGGEARGGGGAAAAGAPPVGGGGAPGAAGGLALAGRGPVDDVLVARHHRHVSPDSEK